MTISLNLSSVGTAYTISNITVTANKVVSIDIGTPVALIVTINVQSGSSVNVKSGNPGYRSGYPLRSDNITNLLLNSILDITNPQMCKSVQNQGSGPQFVINFNQPSTYTCTFNSQGNSKDSCSSNLAIDNIFSKNITILKYGSLPSGISGETISVSGINNQDYFCNKQTIILNILYSQAGWTEDPQSYILAAEITTRNAPGSTFGTKSLIINWINVPPSSIASPPQNYFYQYFSLLWLPLTSGFTSASNSFSSTFSRLLHTNHLLTLSISIIVLFFITLF